MTKLIGYIATITPFQIKILANNVDDAIDILMEKAYDLPIVRISAKPHDRLFINLGQPGELNPDKEYIGPEIIITRMNDRGMIIHSDFNPTNTSR